MLHTKIEYQKNYVFSSCKQNNPCFVSFNVFADCFSNQAFALNKKSLIDIGFQQGNDYIYKFIYVHTIVR